MGNTECGGGIVCEGGKEPETFSGNQIRQMNRRASDPWSISLSRGREVSSQ